jgi:MoaA/NifB/PqqE/SkfB family radical SAM enzyme
MNKYIKVLRNSVPSFKNVILREFTERLKPIRIWYEVTDRCNSRCKGCNIWRKKATPDPLTISEIERTFRDPLFSEMEFILNSGGEAVIRKDIEEILLTEHRVLPNAALHLSTNGILGERIIQVTKTMLQHNIPLEIGVSLDGIGPKHDEIRGVPGNYEKTNWLLKELVSMREKYDGKIKPLVGLTLTNNTVDSYEEVKSYTQELNLPFCVQWYNESPFYDNVGKVSQCSDRDKEKMFEIVQSLDNGLLKKKWIDWLQGKSIKFRCFAMHTFCVLKCNGDIVPCLSLWDLKAGNVKEKTPSEVWHSDAARKAREAVRNCPGCLNSWGLGWSSAAFMYPALLCSLQYKLKKLIHFQF